MALRVAGALILLACGGCGLDESGLAPVDDGGVGVDVSVDVKAPTDGAITDGGGPDVVDSAPPIEAGPCDDDANQCTPPEVPTGWTPVAYVENPTSACAAPFSKQEDDVAYSAGSAACACACTKTSDPDCTTGQIATYYSGDSSCSSQGGSLNFTKGACASIGGFGGASIDNDYESQAIGPQGGSCTAQTQSSGSVATTPVRLCEPDPSCMSAACNGYAPAGYSACIVTDGDQPCPTGSSFAKKISIAKSATATCADCGTGCNLTGSCQSPEVHFFTDGQCNNELVALPSDGKTCAATGHGGSTVRGATYTATPSFTCHATGTTSVQISPTTPRTVCCR
ncbi:MAG TPA: hypothetical protein VGH28_22020 [Polyangiaceae bacterium]|jgi:hypothetical protein